jgi:hypothetical protein
MIIKKLFLLLSFAFFFYSHAERTVMQSTFVATVGILATQMGMYAYYAKKGSLEKFLLKNKGVLAVYIGAHCILNYLFFSVLKSVKNERLL